MNETHSYQTQTHVIQREQTKLRHVPHPPFFSVLYAVPAGPDHLASCKCDADLILRKNKKNSTWNSVKTPASPRWGHFAGRKNRKKYAGRASLTSLNTFVREAEVHDALWPFPERQPDGRSITTFCQQWMQNMINQIWRRMLKKNGNQARLFFNLL